ncbi:hypothetical protein [Novosphingobium sp. 9]|uniref:hypothetical protein n=1 Tax=Novosphingobium sp. 9 TaxID=2025349 RepID=UPI0021B59656|nr:hypothetical protein [Novosphingobium sp. 9]
MSVSDNDLAAFADGELAPDEAERVRAALAADPALAQRLEAQRKLRAMLGAHLDPVLEEPVPPVWTAMIEKARASKGEVAAEPEAEAAPVIDFAAAKAQREALPLTPPRTAWLWRAGPAIAASLVLGLFLGTQLVPRGQVVERGGQLFAAGALKRGLDTQLASAQADGGVRILTSFRRGDGDFCRVYEASASAGLACHDQGHWVLERTTGRESGETGEYRQAGSAEADLMTAAQDMAKGDPLDATAEQQARASGWEK